MKLAKTLLGTAIAALLVSPMSSAKDSAPLLRAPVAVAKGAAVELDGPTDRLVVKFHPVTSTAGRQMAASRVAASNGISAKVGRELAVGANVLTLDRKLDRVSVDALLAQLRADPTVEYAIVDRLMKPLEGVSPKFSPTDPEYANQWHYFDPVGGLNMPKAWNLGRGYGVVVAVLDTGITDHPDLIPNTLAGGYDFISTSQVGGDGNGRDADPHDVGDYVIAGECGEGSSPSNSSWHGTHVSGTVAAATSNGIGVAGTAPRAKVLPVRVLGKCGGYTSDIADAIVWSSGGAVSGVPANANPAEVINMSLGGGGSCDPMTQAAINTAVANGTVVVVAAGNSNESVDDFSPASCANVISVASNDQNGWVSDFSNVGALIDVAAPGGAPYIWSTVNAGTTVPAAHTYGGMQGTSMAAPHVAGVVAMMQDLDTNTPSMVEALLKLTAKPMGIRCPGLCGFGKVDAFGAMNAVNGLLPPLPSIPVRNGVAQSVPTTTAGQQIYFVLDTLAPLTNLSFKTAGGAGNANLYVRFGAKPTTSTYDCRSIAAGNIENCAIASPMAGKYYVMIHTTVGQTGAALTAKYNGTTFLNPTDISIREQHVSPVVSQVFVHGRSGMASASTPVRVIVRHDYVSDTSAELQAPDGTKYTLWTTGMRSATDQTHMLDLSSEAKNGVWRLRVRDDVNKDVGHIDYFSMKM